MNENTTTQRWTRDARATAAAAEGTHRRTRTLLGCGAVAGPLFVAVTAIQVATRDEFDLREQPISLLSLGDLGWIQITNFVTAGLLFLAGAAGMRQALQDGRGRRWGPRLVGLVGASLVWAGVFVTDPANGYPPGTPAGSPDDPSWHAVLHNLAPVAASAALVAACLVFARRFAAQGRRGWVAYCLTTALVLLAPSPLFEHPWFFVLIAASSSWGWVWASALAVHLRRRLGD
jgi:hypothetical protein